MGKQTLEKQRSSFRGVLQHSLQWISSSLATSLSQKQSFVLIKKISIVIIPKAVTTNICEHEKLISAELNAIRDRSLNKKRNFQTFLLCWKTFPCPLGDDGPVSRKEECYLMVWDQKRHHYWNPPLSGSKLERFSFRPTAHLFWSFLATCFWACNIARVGGCKILKGQVRNMQKFKAYAVKKKKITSCLAKTCRTSKIGVMQLLNHCALLINFMLLIHFDRQWGHTYATII